MMKISVEKRSMIRPAKETPIRKLWLSEFDHVMSERHVPLVYFFRHQPDDSNSNFFEANVLKNALSQVLVAFYPLAGRLGRDEDGRLEIDCNGQGALFIEAETTSVIEELGDFSPRDDTLQLVPSFDTSPDTFSYPLFAAQLTRFRCGGVCIGVCIHHTATDGISTFHFMNSWAEVARGMPVSVTPFIDRTLLHARVPPMPLFHHSEYDPRPTMIHPSIPAHDHSKPKSTKNFKLTTDQLTALKSKFQNTASGVRYTTHEILCAHIWCCVCKTRDLPYDQVTKLYIPTNGRPRFSPPLPAGFFGNVQFTATISCSAGEILLTPLVHTVEKIHSSLKKMDDTYLRSAIAYLKQQPDLTTLRRKSNTSKTPNLDIVDWTKLPLYDADFGWGTPIYVGRAKVAFEEMAYIVPGPTNDKSTWLVICLDTDKTEQFQSLLYDFTQIKIGQPKL